MFENELLELFNEGDYGLSSKLSNCEEDLLKLGLTSINFILFVLKIEEKYDIVWDDDKLLLEDLTIKNIALILANLMENV